MPRDLHEEALKLPVDERLRLAQELIRSIDEGEDADADQAWRAELERRVNEVSDGTVATVDADEAHRRVQETLHVIRQKRRRA